MSSMDLYLQGENENKKSGMLLSIIAHLLILLLLFPPFFRSQIIPPGQKGILVQFGSTDLGSEDTEKESQTSADEENKDLKAVTPVEEKKKEVKEATIKSPQPVIEQEVIRDEKAEIAAAEERRKQQEREEAERKKAEEEAQKQKEFDDKKRKFGDILADGQTKGETQGDQGNPTGDPDKSVLDNIAKGSGKVGGGLSQRGVVFEPDIRENSQKSGTVVVEICVDTTGKVVSAKFTQRGSTTTDKSLVDVAIEGAKKYKFSSSEIEKQCGTVTVKFIVR